MAHFSNKIWVLIPYTCSRIYKPSRGVGWSSFSENLIFLVGLIQKLGFLYVPVVWESCSDVVAEPVCSARNSIPEVIPEEMSSEPPADWSAEELPPSWFSCDWLVPVDDDESLVIPWSLVWLFELEDVPLVELSF